MAGMLYVFLNKEIVCIAYLRDCVCAYLVILQASRIGLRLVMLWGRIGEYVHPFLYFIHEVENCEK